MKKLEWIEGNQWHYITKCGNFTMPIFYSKGEPAYGICWRENGQLRTLGFFATPDEAARAAEEKANDVPQ